MNMMALCGPGLLRCVHAVVHARKGNAERR
jgi:hypothetical protein